MNRLLPSRPLLSSLIALAALAAAGAANARTDVQLSIGVPAPFTYVQPAPVVVSPPTVYVRPAPVYRYEWEHRDHRHHGWRRGPWGDADRDGIPNRYDRHPGFGRDRWHDRDSRGDHDRDQDRHGHNYADRGGHR